MSSAIVPEVINKGGRPKGARNKDLLRRMSDAESFASAVVDDPTYLNNLRVRAIAGDLSPAVEALLLYYRYGKPVNRVEVTDGDKADLSNYSIAEIAERVDHLKSLAVGLEKKRISLNEPSNGSLKGEP